jgi:hypothetical protein
MQAFSNTIFDLKETGKNILKIFISIVDKVIQIITFKPNLLRNLIILFTYE